MSTHIDRFYEDDWEYQEFLRDLDDTRERQLHVQLEADRLDDFCPAEFLWFGQPNSPAQGSLARPGETAGAKSSGIPEGRAHEPAPRQTEEVRGAGDSSSCGDASAVGGSNQPPSSSHRSGAASFERGHGSRRGDGTDERTAA